MQPTSSFRAGGSSARGMRLTTPRLRNSGGSYPQKRSAASPMRSPSFGTDKGYYRGANHKQLRAVVWLEEFCLPHPGLDSSSLSEQE
jgi:hypothetical protein